LEEAKAIHQLVAAVQRSKTVSRRARRRAGGGSRQAMEAALAPVNKLEAA
jgi:hypothetical protein